MTVYIRLTEAVAQLRDKLGVFTELDAIEISSPGWTDEEYGRGMREANNLCGRLYRIGQLCRYGPVSLPDGTRDYARLGPGKIVYADAEDGPEYWETPNGRFPKLFAIQDEIARPGRRIQTNRNDGILWGEKGNELMTRRRGSDPRIRELEAMLATRDERIDELEDALERRLASQQSPHE